MSKRLIMLIVMCFTLTVLGSDLKLYKQVGAGADSYWIYPFIKIENSGPETINLANYTIEYYFYCSEITPEDNVNELLNSQIWYFGLNHGDNMDGIFSVDFVNLGKVYENGKKKANVKAVYHFNSVNVPAGEYALAECGIHRTNWGTFNKNNDWSYENTTTMTETQLMVIRDQNGEVIWGLDPTKPLDKVVLYTQVNGYGHISLNPPGGVYDIGTDVTLTAVPDEGYEFEKWISVAVDPTGSRGVATSMTIRIVEDLFVAAFFKDEYTDIPDPSYYDNWNQLSTSSSIIDGNLLLSQDLHIGARGAGNKFVLHSRSHDGVGDKGDFLELAFEKNNPEGEFHWGTGFVLKPSINKDSCNFGLGTTNPREKLDVRGNIALNSGKLIFRNNYGSSGKVSDLASWRYYEGITTGLPADKYDPFKYGLNINSLSWSGSNGGYQDPITFHAGHYNFYTFDKLNNYKESKVMSIDGNGSVTIGKNRDQHITIDSNAINIKSVGVFNSDRSISLNAMDTHFKMKRNSKTINKFVEISPDEIRLNRSDEPDSLQEGLDTKLSPGRLSMTREWGNWLELRNAKDNSGWMFHNPKEQDHLTFGWEPNFADNIDNAVWSILVLHPNKSVSIGTSTPGSNEEKLVVAGDTKIDGKIEVAGVKGSLVVDQTIEAKEFKVGDWVITDAPDFVFEKGYDLKSLKDVETFINKEKHLPGIPSAEEIKTEGFDLVKMNMLLLQKIEELTLHSIEQQKKIEKLEEKIEDMK